MSKLRFLLEECGASDRSDAPAVSGLTQRSLSPFSDVRTTNKHFEWRTKDGRNCPVVAPPEAVDSTDTWNILYQLVIDNV